MSFLNLDGSSSSKDIVQRLEKERTVCASKSIGFDAVDVNEQILQAAVTLFRDRQQKQQQSQTQCQLQQQLEHQQQQQKEQEQLQRKEEQERVNKEHEQQQNLQRQEEEERPKLQRKLPFRAQPILQIPRRYSRQLQEQQEQQQQQQQQQEQQMLTNNNISGGPSSNNGNDITMLFDNTMANRRRSSTGSSSHNNNINTSTSINSKRSNSIVSSSGIIDTSSYADTSSTTSNTIVKLEKLCINNCKVNPYLEYLIEAAMGMDLFLELELQGNIDDDDAGEEETIEEKADNTVFALDALGFRMRFSRRLRKLELLNLPLTRDHAESLMYGIETTTNTATLTSNGSDNDGSSGSSSNSGNRSGGCRLDTLFMEGVRFVDDDEEDDNDEVDEDDEAVDDTYTVGDPDITAGNKRNKSLECRFPHGHGTSVVQELCEGIPNNNTLTTIELQRCHLTDTQIAMIFDSLANHPTVTKLNLSENYCRNLGLEALNRLLTTTTTTTTGTTTSTDNTTTTTNNTTTTTVSNNSNLEYLDLSYQFMDDGCMMIDDTIMNGEEGQQVIHRMNLNILTRDCTTQDRCARIYPTLRKLVLCGNQIDDSDMKEIVFLIRHRFSQLEDVDLRFNDITTDGLQTFADYSDPNNNNDNFLTHTTTTHTSATTTTTNNTNDNGSTATAIQYYKDHFPPPSSRLRTIRLTNNPLIMTPGGQTSIVLLNLLKLYPELQQIQSNLEWEDGTDISRYIQHLLDINRAGRMLLLASSNTMYHTTRRSIASSHTSSHSNSIANNNNNNTMIVVEEDEDDERQQVEVQLERRNEQQRQSQRRPIPLSVWPLVLARLTRKAKFPQYIPKKNSLNGMFYLIRHGPIVVEQFSSRRTNSNNNSRKQKSTSTTTSDGGSCGGDGGVGNTATTGDESSSNNTGKKRKRPDRALGGYATIDDFLRCELGINK